MKRYIFFIIIRQLAFSAFAQDNHPAFCNFRSEKIAPLSYQIKLHDTLKEPYHIYHQASACGIELPAAFFFDQKENVEFVVEMRERGDEQKDEAQLSF
ncbi:hypothetical protein FFJ24_004615 [Pedobacter sp. KBS0701]|uniref:hypothetical protein n=1 Tax=Pedobacter sp. KBS0701 TaxID=2578106 RepID=UPI00110F29CD|nr:hypothetical protein [Pedobacter sp. KBS0701]QDW24144.1 hypothetical protein FFJ24_004615 [Pedobacter sp. KBS0701]